MSLEVNEGSGGPPPILKRSSVLYICGTNETNGFIELSSNLLGRKVHQVVGGVAALLALADDGVYSVPSGALLASFELSNASVGKSVVVGLSPKGSLYSWGEGTMGELGLGPTQTYVSEPKRINYNASFIGTSTGAGHSVAYDARGNAYSWGQNFDKQLGLFSKSLDDMRFARSNCEIEDLLFMPRYVPLSLKKPVAKMACGSAFTIAITKDGDVWSWGAGESGQLGTGRCTNRELPAQVVLVAAPATPSSSSSLRGKKQKERVQVPPPAVSDVACGAGHVVVCSREGRIFVWGLNKRGQLGLGDTATRFAPVEISVAIDNEVEPSLPENVDLQVQELSQNRSQTPSQNESQTLSQTEEQGSMLRLAKVFAEGNSTAGITASGRLLTWGAASYGRLMHEPVSSRAAVTHSLSPQVVNELRDVEVQSFAMSSTCSAALVLTSVRELWPQVGPQRNTSAVSIRGLGMWNSDSIVVRFTSKSGLVPPRSCTAQLTSADTITCKPPRLAETGVYDVTVSMDGAVFLPEVLTFRAHKEVGVSAVTPRLVDLRRNDMNVVTLTVKGLVVHDPPAPHAVDESQGEGASPATEEVHGHGHHHHAHAPSIEPAWPTEADLDLSVKLYISSSLPGAAQASLSEIILPGRLLPLPPAAHMEAPPEEPEAHDADAAGTIVSDGASHVSHHHHHHHHAPDRQVSCDVDFTSLAPPDALVVIRAALSLNGVDFGPASPDSAPIICHAFQPTGACPACCHAEIGNGDGETEADENRVISVLGNSFIPTSKLPAGLTIEAVVSAEFPGGSKPVKGKPVPVGELAVPVTCTAADSLTFTMPTLSKLQEALAAATGKTSSQSQRPKSRDGPSEELEVLAKVRFRMVQAQATGVSAPSSAKSRDKKESAAKDKGKKGAKDKEEPAEPAYLSTEAITVFLYRPQPVTVTPVLARRGGGRVLVVLGTHKNGLNFFSSDATVILSRPDLGLRAVVPGSVMLGLNDAMPVPLSSSDSAANDVGGMEGLDGDAEFGGDGAGLDLAGEVPDAPQSVEDGGSQDPEQALGVEGAGGSMMSGGSLRSTASVVTALGQPHKIVFTLPPVFPYVPPPVPEPVPVLEGDGEEGGDGAGADGANAVPVEDPDRIVAAGDEASARLGEAAFDHAEDPMQGQGEGQELEQEQVAGEGEIGLGSASVLDALEQPEALQAPPNEVVSHPEFLDWVLVQVLLDGRTALPASCGARVELFTSLQLSPAPLDVPKGGAVVGTPLTLTVGAGLVESAHCIVRIRGPDATASASGGVPVDVPGTVEVAKKPTQADSSEAPNADGGEGARDGEQQARVQLEATDSGGSSGTVSFTLPDVAAITPEIRGKDKWLFVDVSIDGGETFDCANEATLNVK